MINILEVVPAVSSAVSFYRARLPLLRLQQKYPSEIMLYPYHNGPVTWDYILLFDLVFIQRPVDSHHYNVIKAAAQYNIPVWIDYDDLLCNIPEDNPSHDGYNAAKIKMIGECIRLASVVTVSTEDLKKYLSKKYGCARKMRVVPNALDTQIFDGKPVFKNKKNVFWRGSMTHQKDLLDYADPIVDCLQKQKFWHIDFLGYNPFFITSGIKNCGHHPAMPLDKYIGILGRLNYAVCIVPLHDHPFNHSKSCIAWQEATYAGAVCLAPDWKEWQKPGIVNYANKTDFYLKLKAMISGRYDLKSMHQKSWQYLSRELNLDKINNLRYEIIKSLPLREYQTRSL